MKKIATFLLGVITMFSGVAAHAQTSAITNTDCTPTLSDLAAIQAVQNDPSLTVAQELNQEVALRKQLLAEVIACATTDAQNLQAQVNAITTKDGGAAIKATNYSGKVNDAITFYGIESAKLANAGIKGTQGIAKEMLAWRAANYLPLKEDTSDLILWSQNQNLFQTAENRSTQTERVVAFIEAAAENSDLQTALKDAQASLGNAESENSDAENSLAQLQPPDQSLVLIQQSLQALADTYQKFSDLNTLIQTLLPTTSSQ